MKTIDYTNSRRSKALDYTAEQCKQNPVIFSNFGNGQPTHEPENHADFEYISINTFACIDTTPKLKNLTKAKRAEIGGVFADKQTLVAQASGSFADLNGKQMDQTALINAIADIACEHGYIVLKSRNDGYTYRIR